MDKPQSIIMFKNLFLGILLIGIIQTFIIISQASSISQVSSIFPDASLFIGPMLIYTILGWGVSIFLVYRIFYKKCNPCKWVYSSLTSLGVLVSIPSIFSGEWPNVGFVNFLSMLSLILSVLIVIMLFRSDSRDWFASKNKPIESEYMKRSD